MCARHHRPIHSCRCEAGATRRKCWPSLATSSVYVRTYMKTTSQSAECPALSRPKLDLLINQALSLQAKAWMTGIISSEQLSMSGVSTDHLLYTSETAILASTMMILLVFTDARSIVQTCSKLCKPSRITSQHHLKVRLAKRLNNMHVPST